MKCPPPSGPQETLPSVRSALLRQPFYGSDECKIVLDVDNLPDARIVCEKLRHEIIHHAMGQVACKMASESINVWSTRNRIERNTQVVTLVGYKTIVDSVLKTRYSNNATMKKSDASPEVRRTWMC